MNQQFSPTVNNSNVYTADQKEENQIALRPDSNGEIDDIVIKDVKIFHMERMNKNMWWFSVRLYSGEEMQFDIFPTVKGFNVEVKNCPKTLLYEKGSIIRGIDDK